MKRIRYQKKLKQKINTEFIIFTIFYNNCTKPQFFLFSDIKFPGNWNFNMYIKFNKLEI